MEQRAGLVVSSKADGQIDKSEGRASVVTVMVVWWLEASRCGSARGSTRTWWEVASCCVDESGINLSCKLKDGCTNRQEWGGRKGYCRYCEGRVVVNRLLVQGQLDGLCSMFLK